MARRSILIILGAAAMLLAAMPATPASAAPAAADPPVPYGWILQLRNTVHSRARNENLTNRAFRALVNADKHRRELTWVDDNKTPDDPSDDIAYKGLALWRLVGRIDDRYPATFNKARAERGYNVVIEALDGFAVTYTSAEVKALRNALIVADRMDGQALPLGSASIKGDPPVASWKPAWPSKLVSSDPSIFGSRKPAGIARISIVPAEPVP
jgi:hypothetical protein